MTSTVYSTGTVSVTNGSAVVTGAGTAWQVALVTGGMFSQAGLAVPILSVESDTSLTLAYPWPGVTAAGSAYAIDRSNSDATNVVDLYDRLARVLVDLSLVGIHPNASGTIAERDAIVLTTDDEGFLFLYAELGFDLAFYRWSGTAWDGPFGVKGEGGVGSGGLGLPAPGSANKFPYYTGPNTVTLGDITAFGRALVSSAVAAVTDNRVVRFDGTTGKVQNSPVSIDDAANMLGIASLFATGLISTAANNSFAGGTFSATGATAGFRWINGNLHQGSTASALLAGHLSFFNPNGQVGGVNTSGSATTFNTTSDYRLKCDVEPLVTFTLDEEHFSALPDSLLRIMALRPVRHRWLVDPDGPWTHGQIAHEAQAVTPHAVSGEKDAVEDIGTAITADEQHVTGIAEYEAPPGSEWSKTGTRPVHQMIDPSKQIADLIAAVQELTLMNLELADRIAALEAA